MEHKLILGGGEQYLPFARSRIKALRATGLQYASNHFVLPDATVKVRIEPGYDYIRIEGTGSCVFHMDSGVVDVLAIGEAAPARYLSGILHETNSVQAYNAPFVAPSEGDTTWRLNPGETGQFSGSLYSDNGFTGKVPYDLDPARSFKPALRAVSPATTPATFEDNPADDGLAAKKALTVLCPASIFTGRCRLYVQAVYGQHLNEYRGDTITRTPPMPTIVSDTSAAPALMFDAYRRATEPSASVLIDTSCGVWLDPATGKHWLFNPIGGQLYVYPLISSKCGESLRKYLVTISPSVPTPLTAADRDHLEAYILASCLPYDARKVAATGAITGGAYSMGYGWHWNWTGITADTVINDTFEQGGGNGAMRSTHYRVTVGHSVVDGVDVWTAEQTIVEGPKEWAVYRALWTILEPEYSIFALSKTTPKNSILFNCDAPFYAFYVGDELKVCRVRVTLNSGNDADIVFDNAFPGFTGPSEYACRTYGLNEGSRTVLAAGSSYYSAVITCGDEVSAELAATKVITSPATIEVFDKVPGAWFSGFGPGGYGTRTFEISDDYFGGHAFIEETSSLVDEKSTRYVSFKVRESSWREEYTSSAVVIIPLYDAQAVYFRSVTETGRYVTASTTKSLDQHAGGAPPAFLIRSTTDVTPDGHKLALLSGCFPADGHRLLSTTTDTIAPTITTTSLVEKLICTAGSVNATFTHLGEISNNAIEEVATGYYTLTGTDTELPVALASGHISAVGVGGSVAVPVLVGWI